MPTTQAKPSHHSWLVQLPLIIVGIIGAVLLARSGVLEQLAINASGVQLAVVSLVLGLFYSSVITVAAATVGFVQLAHAGAPLWPVAIIGGLGAMIADVSIFEILKLSIVDDLIRLIQGRSGGSFSRLLRFRLVKTLFVVLGAVIVATPIPDEIGLAMMGVGKARRRLVALVGFFLNTIGIVGIMLLAR